MGGVEKSTNSHLSPLDRQISRNVGSLLGELSVRGLVLVNKLQEKFSGPNSFVFRCNPLNANVVYLSEDKELGIKEGHHVVFTDFAYDEEAAKQLGLEEAAKNAYQSSDAAWVVATAINQRAHEIRNRPLGAPKNHTGNTKFQA